MKRNRNGTFKEKYNEKQLSWISENYKEHRLKDLTLKFNQNFNQSITVSQMQYITNQKLNLKTNNYYTKKEDLWIKENSDNFRTYKELTKEFNEKFNKNKKQKSIEMRCQKVLGIKRKNNVGQFEKGKIFRNKNELPIGTERQDLKTGNLYIKTKLHEEFDIPQYQESKSREYPYWTLKQQKMYEDSHGKIGNDEMIIFLDGDRKNFNLENLFCISRKVWIRLVNNGWYGKDKQVTRTAIELIKLKQEIRGVNYEQCNTFGEINERS